MLQVLLALACFFVQNLFPAKLSQAEEKQASEKINIDVESLGLDAVDQKLEVKTEKKDVQPPKDFLDLPLKPILAKQNELPHQQSKNSSPSVLQKPTPEPEQNATGIISKIQNFLNKDKKEPKAPSTSEEKKPDKTEKYINSTKKRNLKKRLEAEKKRKEAEKKEQQKLQKLNELREKYLIKPDLNGELKPLIELEEGQEKIIPHRKEINQFTSEEMPALPILSKSRSQDNLHIPSILTPRENTDILFDAIKNGDVGFFNSAYKTVENPNVRNFFGDTLVTCATLLQKHAILASALSKGANPDLPNKLGYTPIQIAIELMDSESLELLVDNNADINYLDAFGRNYLMHAARVGFLAAVELFVSLGVDVNAMDDDGFTALSIAYRYRKEVIVKFLLKNGAKTWVEKPYNPEKQSLIKELENRWSQ